jgi:sterol desaturase/sphingolipid hydroxylase (fatty acid hydroxylase superfamily)
MGMSFDIEQFFEYRLILTGVWLVALLFLGFAHPLRPNSSRASKRVLLNLSLGGVTELAQRWISAPLIAWAATLIGETHSGPIPAHWPLWARAVAALLLLDFILYVWHRLNHEVPFLWRFHRVHHSDPHMDASTAVRFHPGEFLLASAPSLFQLWVTGFQVELYLVYDLAVFLAVPFHHANLRLPPRVSAILQTLVITPELHAIHHSIRDEETQSNYGTVFSFWDRIFRTRRSRAPAIDIEIGCLPDIPQHFLKLLAAPTGRVKPNP